MLSYDSLPGDLVFTWNRGSQIVGTRLAGDGVYLEARLIYRRNEAIKH